MTRALALMMGVVGMVALVGCGANNPAGPGSVQEHIFIDPAQDERLIGVWEMRISGGAPLLVTFKRGGEVDVTAETGNEPSVTVSGTWQVSENKLTMKASPSKEMDVTIAGSILKQFATYTYSIKGDVLILTNPDGEEIRCEKP